MSTSPIADWYLDNLVCPRDRSSLEVTTAGRLRCERGDEYPVVAGIPVMLVGDRVQTMALAHASLRAATRPEGDADRAPLYVGSLGLNDRERQGVRELARSGRSKVDPVVAYLVGATNGNAYAHLIGALAEYPIPDVRLPPGHGETMLDVGCNWGRWCLAAARKGYRAIGIDPSLGAVMAARRVAAELGLEVTLIVGDARYLPLRDASIHRVFSYSVIQHFSREDAALAVSEAGRVLSSGGQSLVQMPTKYGVRCLYHQARRRFREARQFEVRYWTVPALRRLFARAIGPTEISVDCYFGIGLQRSDTRLMPLTERLATGVSERLRAASHYVSALAYAADSVYLSSTKTQ